MRKVLIKKNNVPAAILMERDNDFLFYYLKDYSGKPVSLVLAVSSQEIVFDTFPSFLDNLLPEGQILEAMLKREKIDSDDYLSQILVYADDFVGDLTCEEIFDA